MTERGLWASGLLALLLIALVCTLHHFRDDAQPATSIAAPTPSAPVKTAPAANVATTPTPAANTASAPATEATAATSLEPSLRADYSGGLITLNGVVPDLVTKNGIVERARALYGADKVIDKIDVKNTKRPRWFATLAPKFPPDLRSLQSGSIYSQDGALVLDGKVAYDAERASVASALNNWFGAELKLDSRLAFSGAPATAPAPAPAPAPAATPTPAGPDSTTSVSPSTAGSPTVLYDLGAVRFRTSSALLSQTAKSTLRKIAGAIRHADAGARYGVAGFADSRGSDEFNLKLSERRAKVVKAYLQRLGVSDERLDVQAEGSAQPVGDNATVSGRSANRRVEVRLL